MKPILFLLLLLMAFPMDAQDRRRALIQKVNSDKAAGGGSCPADGSPSDEQTGTSNFGTLNGNDGVGFVGQVWGNGTKSLCKVAFNLTKSAGDISGKTFHAYIYSLSGNNLNSVLATSAGVTGDNGWSQSWVVFTFSGNPSIADGNAVVVSMDGAQDNSNYAIAHGNTSGSFGGHADIWTLGGSGGFFSDPLDTSIRVYYFQ